MSNIFNGIFPEWYIFVIGGHLGAEIQCFKKMAIDQEYKRFKQLREDLNLTQTAFAELLGMGSTTADIERGRTKIPGFVVKELLKRYQVNPLWLFGESNEKYLHTLPARSGPSVVTVDNTGHENIVMVNVKAAAGYPDNIGDANWFDTLPAFAIPLPEYRNATFRGFQVEGDSMQPVLQTGDWILGKSVVDLDKLSTKRIYVVVTIDSVLVKKVREEEDGVISLISLNPVYPPIKLHKAEIRELWQVSSKISSSLDTETGEVDVRHLYHEMKALREEVQKFAK